MKAITKLGVHVATYQDIASHFSAYRKARQGHINALKDAARSLFERYSESLELAQKSWPISGGERQPFVQIGAFDGDEFEPRKFVITEESGKSPQIQFAIALALSGAPGSMLDTIVYVDLSLSMATDVFYLTFEDSGDVVAIHLQGDDSRFDAACAEISQSIMGQYRLSDFPQV